MQVMKQSLHSPEQRFHDPQYTARLQKQDLATISQKLNQTLGVRLSDLISGKLALSQTSRPASVSKETGEIGTQSQFPAPVSLICPS